MSQQSSVANKKSMMKCATCGKEGAEMRCGACHSEIYCSGACQKAHWSMHKMECKQTQARTKQLEKEGGEGGSGVGGSGVGGVGVGGSGVGGSGVGRQGDLGQTAALSPFERHQCQVQVFNASCYDHREELDRLLKQSGLDVNVTEPNLGFTAVHAAVEKGYDQCLSMLIGYGGADLAKVSKRGRAPIHLACNNGRIACLLLLLDSGVDPNVRTANEYRATPAQICSIVGHVKCLALLLDRGVDIHSQDKNGSTLIHEVCTKGHLKCVKLLISRGARINERDRDGLTPLDWARALDNSDCVQFLLEQNAVGSRRAAYMPVLTEDIKVQTRDDSSCMFALYFHSFHLIMSQFCTSHRK
jgi:ankyrin repeat protein